MVNIILSTYNGETYIGEQIESILDSEYPDFRLFVFDDVSSDKTPEIVSGYEKAHPEKICFVRNGHNKGCCRNFLEGLAYAFKNAPADYYVFCDQDDVWLENRLNVCLAHMRELEEEYSADTPLLEFTDAILVDEHTDSLGNTFFKADRLNTRNLEFSRILMENRVIGCTSFMNAALARKITDSTAQGFDKRIRFHDWWAALAASAFGRISFIDVPTVLYRQHGKNVVGQKDFSGYVKDRLKDAGDNRSRIRKTVAQASAFHKAYSSKLSDRNEELLREFIALGWAGPIERRRLILKNGFYKSGLIRNIGLLTMI